MSSNPFDIQNSPGMIAYRRAHPELFNADGTPKVPATQDQTGFAPTNINNFGPGGAGTPPAPYVSNQVYDQGAYGSSTYVPPDPSIVRESVGFHPGMQPGAGGPAATPPSPFGFAHTSTQAPPTGFAPTGINNFGPGGAFGSGLFAGGGAQTNPALNQPNVDIAPPGNQSAFTGQPLQPYGGNAQPGMFGATKRYGAPDVSQTGGTLTMNPFTRNDTNANPYGVWAGAR